MPWHSMAFSLFALSSSGGGAVCSNQLGVTSPILVETTDGQRRSLSTQMIRKKKSKRKEKGKVAAWHSTNNEHIRARKPERLEKGLSQTFSREAGCTVRMLYLHTLFSYSKDVYWEDFGDELAQVCLLLITTVVLLAANASHIHSSQTVKLGFALPCFSPVRFFFFISVARGTWISILVFSLMGLRERGVPFSFQVYGIVFIPSCLRLYCTSRSKGVSEIASLFLLDHHHRSSASRTRRRWFLPPPAL